MKILKGIGLIIGWIILIIGIILCIIASLILCIPCLIIILILKAGVSLISACDKGFLKEKLAENSIYVDS